MTLSWKFFKTSALSPIWLRGKMNIYNIPSIPTISSFGSSGQKSPGFNLIYWPELFGHWGTSCWGALRAMNQKVHCARFNSLGIKNLNARWLNKQGKWLNSELDILKGGGSPKGTDLSQVGMKQSLRIGLAQVQREILIDSPALLTLLRARKRIQMLFWIVVCLFACLLFKF